MAKRYSTMHRRPETGRAPSGEIPPDDLAARLRDELRRRTAREIAVGWNVSPETVTRAASGQRVMRASLAAIRAAIAIEDGQ